MFRYIFQSFHLLSRESIILVFICSTSVPAILFPLGYMKWARLLQWRIQECRMYTLKWVCWRRCCDVVHRRFTKGWMMLSFGYIFSIFSASHWLLHACWPVSFQEKSFYYQDVTSGTGRAVNGTINRIWVILSGYVGYIYIMVYYDPQCHQHGQLLTLM